MIHSPPPPPQKKVSIQYESAQSFNIPDDKCAGLFSSSFCYTPCWLFFDLLNKFVRFLTHLHIALAKLSSVKVSSMASIPRPLFIFVDCLLFCVFFLFFFLFYICIPTPNRSCTVMTTFPFDIQDTKKKKKTELRCRLRFLLLASVLPF